MTAASPRVTVVFLLYNAARTVRSLVAALDRQQRPGHPAQADWLEAIFMDDASRDATRDELGRCLAEQGAPAHWRTVVNPENHGLAATLNRAFSLVRTPYVLSCHLDCLFGDDAYVSRMVDLMDAHPKAGAITGKPKVPPASALHFAEKVNLVANLMDVLPPETSNDLVPVGFAEGRCDIFRLAALEAAGFYDTTLRTAGEDQVLAARMRGAGYEVYQAPKVEYLLSVSDEQDTVGKLLRHQRLFGRAHPYILLRAENASAGVAGARAGANRRARLFLRLQQVGATVLLVAALALAIAGVPRTVCAILVAVVLLVKVVLFHRHLRVVAMRPSERLIFFALQPALDVSYTWGLVQGLVRLAGGSPARPID
jgi:cellulose synthase/poly-beta-1,6-N-acetylglucosamine synthase-like glycosyltransferase